MAKPVQIERGSSVEVCVLLLLLLLLYNAIVNKQSYAKASKREREREKREEKSERNIKGHRHRAFLNLVKMLRESEARDANVAAAAAAVGERPRRGHPDCAQGLSRALNLSRPEHDKGCAGRQAGRSGLGLGPGPSRSATDAGKTEAIGRTNV